MKTYTATRPFRVSSGTVALNDAQARRCRSAVRATKKKGEFLVMRALEFKAGERFGWDGSVPKGDSGVEELKA